MKKSSKKAGKDLFSKTVVGDASRKGDGVIHTTVADMISDDLRLKLPKTNGWELI